MTKLGGQPRVNGEKDAGQKERAVVSLHGAFGLGDLDFFRLVIPTLVAALFHGKSEPRMCISVARNSHFQLRPVQMPGEVR